MSGVISTLLLLFSLGPGALLNDASVLLAPVLAQAPAAEQPAAPPEEPAAPEQQAAPEQAAPAPETSEEEASSEAEDEGSSFSHSGALGYLIEGGVFMWPILLLGILAAGVIIERYRSLKLLSTDSQELREKVRDHLQHDRVEEALKLCNQEQGPVPAILSSGLRKYLLLRELNYDPAKVEEQVVKSMDDYSVHVVAALERHLPILATISSVAPMLGFLGTVSGMIRSFKDIVAQMGSKNIVEAAAGGISEALLTTCFGLIVGIPAFIGYNYFTSVINRFVLDVEESAAELIETVTLQLALDEKSHATNGESTAPAPQLTANKT